MSEGERLDVLFDARRDGTVMSPGIMTLQFDRNLLEEVENLLFFRSRFGKESFRLDVDARIAVRVFSAPFPTREERRAPMEVEDETFRECCTVARDFDDAFSTVLLQGV